MKDFRKHWVSSPALKI